MIATCLVLLFLGGGRLPNLSISQGFAVCIIIYTPLLLYAAIPTTATESCPTFGTDFARGHDTSNTGLWLNFATPAQCTGTAVQWRFCYYAVYTDKKEHEVWLRVYRKNDASDMYDKVVENVINRDVTDSGVSNGNGAVCDGGSPPHCCENLTVNHEIQENDIIGVCMRDEGGNHDPLYSLDEEAPAGYTVYEYPNTDDCSNNHDGDVDSFEASDPAISLTANPGFGLHAHLSVVGKPQLG